MTIAWGEHDRLVGPPKPERRPAGARFLVLPGVGHTPMWDDPELVARTLLEGSAVPASRLDVLGEFPDASERGGAALIVERTENPMWLSNAYLVAEPGGRDRRADRRQRRARAAARAGRARRDRDHPHPRHPSPRRPRRRPRRGPQAARQPAAGRPRGDRRRARRRGRDDPRRRRQARRRRARGRGDLHPRPRRRPPRLPRSTAPTSSPPTSSSRAPSAARWRRAPAASTTSRPR